MNDVRLKLFGYPCRRWVPLVAIAAATSLGACTPGEKETNAQNPAGARPETITHEPCSSGHVDSLDTNHDGKPDITRVLDAAGHEECRIVDLNHDGKPDLYEYFDRTGAVRRREFCYDETGLVNAIETYDAGKLSKREYDISGQHRIDTWDWFDPNSPIDAKTGRPVHPVRRERDTTGDGRVDQWWTWNGDQVSIAVDSNGEGKPDPNATILLGGPASDPANGALAPVPPDAGQPNANDGGGNR